MIAAGKNARLLKGRTVGRRRTEPDTSTYSGRIAARLRMLREKAGKTVDEAARAIGVPPLKLYRWEAGSVAVDADAFPALAVAYGIKLRSLFPDE